MTHPRLTFRLHAVRRMIERRIGVEEVRLVVETGKIVETYPDDSPYATNQLRLGWVDDSPIHVVVASDSDGDWLVVTAYEPDPDRWDDGFARRTRP
jgi:hypothetical protein